MDEVHFAAVVNMLTLFYRLNVYNHDRYCCIAKISFLVKILVKLQ